jgi:hypothetical protein
MKSKNILLLMITAMSLILSAGCKKASSTVFSWDYLGRHYVADSCSVSAGSDSRMLAYSGVTGIAIDGGAQFLPGTYTLYGRNITGQGYLLYTVGGGFTYSQTGTVIITKSDATKMSGSFSATLTDASVISGSFTDVPLR